MIAFISDSSSTVTVIKPSLPGSVAATPEPVKVNCDREVVNVVDSSITVTPPPA